MKKGWEIKKLGDVCVLITDGTHNTPTYLPNGIPFLSVKNLTNGTIDFTNTRFISNKEHKFLTKRCKPEKEDILYTKVGTTGIAKVIDIDKEFSIFVSVALLKIKHDLIFNRYLEHYLNSPIAREQAKKRTRGMANKNLVISDIKEIKISYPEALPEQKRIVAILDEAFVAIEKARTNAEKNLANAREVFDSYLNSTFSSKSEGWEDYKFGELIDVLTDYHANGSYQSLKANVELKEVEDYAWMVRSTDFENNFENDKRFITEEAYNFLGKSKIFGNEIIISKIGNVGKVYLMPKIERPCSLAMNLFLIRVNKKKCQSEFVYRYLNSINGRRQIESRVLGTTTKTITKDNVRNIPVPVPQLNIQNQIILKLNELSAQTKRLEEIYKQKIADLDELKKSILQKAFEGEL